MILATVKFLILFLLTVYSFSVFDYKEYNQSYFGIDHLVIFMYRVISLLLEECVCYDQCVLLAKLCWLLPCFILYSRTKLACYSRYLLTSCFCNSAPYDKKDILFFFFFLLVLVLECHVGLCRTIQLQLLWH